MRILATPIESPRLNGEELSKNKVEHGKAHADYEYQYPADEDYFQWLYLLPNVQRSRMSAGLYDKPIPVEFTYFRQEVLLTAD